MTKGRRPIRDPCTGEVRASLWSLGASAPANPLWAAQAVPASNTNSSALTRFPSSPCRDPSPALGCWSREGAGPCPRAGKELVPVPEQELLCGPRQHPRPACCLRTQSLGASMLGLVMGYILPCDHFSFPVHGVQHMLTKWGFI